MGKCHNFYKDVSGFFLMGLEDDSDVFLVDIGCEYIDREAALNKKFGWIGIGGGYVCEFEKRI